jgi:hypothetical protein
MRFRCPQASTHPCPCPLQVMPEGHVLESGSERYHEAGDIDLDVRKCDLIEPSSAKLGASDHICTTCSLAYLSSWPGPRRPCRAKDCFDFLPLCFPRMAPPWECLHACASQHVYVLSTQGLASPTRAKKAEPRLNRLARCSHSPARFPTWLHSNAFSRTQCCPHHLKGL